MVNLSDAEGALTVEARDESSHDYVPITLTVEAGDTGCCNSKGLELGNEAKWLYAGVGTGEGDWRLTLRGDFEFLPYAYLHTGGGFLTEVHDLLAEAGAMTADTPTAPRPSNPASNTRQVNSLLLLYDGSLPVVVLVTGTDDQGAESGEVRLRVLAGGSRTVTAQNLESGAPGLAGELSDGADKWRLTVRSDCSLRTLSVLENPTGQISNLSTAPSGG